MEKFTRDDKKPLDDFDRFMKEKEEELKKLIPIDWDSFPV